LASDVRWKLDLPDRWCQVLLPLNHTPLAPNALASQNPT
jgi:hypothetical protein